MAEGAGAGAVKPVTVTEGGSVAAREVRHAVVMCGVELGLMRRMEMGGRGVPVMVGRAGGVGGVDMVVFAGGDGSCWVGGRGERADGADGGDLWC